MPCDKADAVPYGYDIDYDNTPIIVEPDPMDKQDRLFSLPETFE